MGITQVPQPLQRSLYLPYSFLEHFLTEGRGANRTAEDAKAIAGDRYLGWQGGKGGITDIRDEKEELASIEMEADRGARRLHNVEGRREDLLDALTRTHTHTHTCTNRRKHARTHWHQHTHTRVEIYTHTGTDTQTHTHTHTHTSTHTHSNTNAQTYANIHIHTNAHTHTHAHTNA